MLYVVIIILELNVDETIPFKLFKYDKIRKQQKFQHQSKSVANLNASNTTESHLTLFKKVNYLTFKKNYIIICYF